jgi:ribosomal protein L29
MAKKKAAAGDAPAETSTKKETGKKADPSSFQALSKLDDKALVHTELQFERDLIEANFRHSTGQLDDVSKLAKIRRSIARARTAERAREREQGLNHNALRDRHRSSFKPEAPQGGTARLGAGFMKGIADKLGKSEAAETE